MPDGPDDGYVRIPRDDLRRLRELARDGKRAGDRIRELEVELELERHRAGPVLRVLARSKAQGAADVREMIEAHGGTLREVEDDQGDELTYQHYGDGDGPDIDEDETDSTELRQALSRGERT